MFYLDEIGIAEILQDLRAQHGGNPYLQVRLDHPLVAWARLGCCTDYGLPAVDQGQAHDCRWSLRNGEALHAHWFPEREYVRFHIDRRDPVRDPFGHLVSDTYMLRSAMLGGLAGAVFISWVPVLVGFVLGGIVGSRVAPRASSVWEFLGYDPRGYWSVQPIAGWPVPQTA